jgi:hypothetical protein
MPVEEDGKNGEPHARKDMSKRLYALQRILIETWSGENPEPVIDGVQTESVTRVIECQRKSVSIS